VSLPPAHRDALAPESDALLARLAAPLADAELYLAGSAALALYLGHRRVRDLDLMAMANRLTPPERRDLLQALLAAAPGMQVETARDGFLALRAASAGGSTGPAVRLYYYPYPLAAPPAEHHGVEVASALDLGLMKLGAIISRGSRRDFVDLYLLCRKLPLGDLLAASPDKFGHVGDFALQALKGLADLSEVAGEPMPQLAEPLAWETVEAWLDESVRELGAAHVGLGGTRDAQEARR
jgi:nucleotidyltransferase AbiEii toxin of type IV toxin-antitoxin system